MKLPNDALLQYIESEVHLLEIAKELNPDYSDSFCDLLEHSQYDIIKYEGPGIYYIDYWMMNPGNHGLVAKKIYDDEVEKLQVELHKLNDV